MNGPLPLEHVIIHVRDALATDGRVGELGLDVVCDGATVVVSGAVSSPERQRWVVTVAQHALREHGFEVAVTDATYVPPAGGPDREPERL